MFLPLHRSKRGRFPTKFGNGRAFAQSNRRDARTRPKQPQSNFKDLLMKAKPQARLNAILGSLLGSRVVILATFIAGMSMTGSASGQVRSNSSSARNALYGSINTSPRVEAPVPLSLDEAIQRGVKHNLQIALAKVDQRTAAGEQLEAVNFFLPTITWSAIRSRNQFNLEAEGFTPGILRSFPIGAFPPGLASSFSPLVTANVVSVQAFLTQTLFDLHSFELYRAARQEILAVDYSRDSAQQDVVQTVADTYLLVLADASNVADAQGLLDTNSEILRQATLKHQAGVSTRLDELRARVQYQQQEQVLISRRNALQKAKVMLKREIGLPADQKIELTDEAPYAELGQVSIEEAQRDAYAHRPDYLRLQAKLRSARYQSRAARMERLPTLKFGGNYGLVGTVGGVYHGAFVAQGTITVPLFKEAQLRGDRDVADAATQATMSQLASLKEAIDAQLRDNLVDIGVSHQLVKVARSNVDLSQSALDDATDRYRSGVADDLPVVQAQAALAAAQAQLVGSLYQFNRAKLGLARNLGIIDQQYRAYLGNPQTTAAIRSSTRNMSLTSAPDGLLRGLITPLAAPVPSKESQANCGQVHACDQHDTRNPVAKLPGQPGNNASHRPSDVIAGQI